MIFIACPYWHENEKIRDYRREKAIQYSTKLMKRGILNYSPLSYTKRYKDDNTKEGYWIKHGLRLVDACDQIHVLCLDGWEKSAGVKGEIERGVKNGAEIRYVRETKRLAFCGSRSLICRNTRKLIKQCINDYQADIIVTHGEPEGVCRETMKICKTRGTRRSLVIHHMEAYRLAGAFEWRSKKVLNDCDHCIFIHDGVSKGTSNELVMAVKMGVPFTYYVYDGNGNFEDKTEDYKRSIEKPENEKRSELYIDDSDFAIDLEMPDTTIRF